MLYRIIIPFPRMPVKIYHAYQVQIRPWSGDERHPAMSSGPRALWLLRPHFLASGGPANRSLHTAHLVARAHTHPPERSPGSNAAEQRQKETLDNFSSVRALEASSCSRSHARN